MAQVPVRHPGRPRARPPDRRAGRRARRHAGSSPCDDPYLPIFYGTVNIWRFLGDPAHGVDLGRAEPVLHDRGLPAARRADRAGGRRERPARGAARLRRDDPPVLPVPRAPPARELEGAGEHPAPRVLRGRPAGAADVRAGRPRRRDRRDAGVPQGRARGPLRALPDDGRRDRRRAPARRRGSGTASTRPRWGRGRCTCGSSGRPTGGPARGPPRSGGLGRRGTHGGNAAGRGYERLRREEADARRRHLAVRRLHGTGVQRRVPDPADRGVERVGERRRASRRRSRCCWPRSARSRSGWIVAQYAKRVQAAGSLYDYVSSGFGPKAGAFGGWLYYGGTTVLASAIACLVGFFMEAVIFTADPAVPGVISSESPLPAWGWSLMFVLAVLADPLPGRAALDAGAADARARRRSSP